MNDGKRPEALLACAQALDELLQHDEQEMTRRTSVAQFSPSGTLLSTPCFGSIGKPLVDTVRRLARAVQSLGASVCILSLGIDFRRYWKFIALTPTPIRLIGRTTILDRPRETPPTADDCRYCFDFVVDGALRLQDAGLGAP